MGIGTRNRHLGYGALVALGVAASPAMADAQTASGDRIDAIERQIKALQGELQQLKAELGAARQEVHRSLR